MISPRLSLLVLRCSNLDRSRALFEAIGLEFIREKHGDGPVHYAADVAGTVLELYPLGNKATTGLRLGFRVSSPPNLRERLVKLGATVVADDGSGLAVRDWDGHVIALSLES